MAAPIYPNQIHTQTFDNQYSNQINLWGTNISIGALNQTSKVMRLIITIVGVVLLIGWAVGYFGFGEAVGAFIHVLLVLAIIALLFGLIRWGFGS